MDKKLNLKLSESDGTDRFDVSASGVFGVAFDTSQDRSLLFMEGKFHTPKAIGAYAKIGGIIGANLPEPLRAKMAMLVATTILKGEVPLDDEVKLDFERDLKDAIVDAMRKFSEGSI